MRYYNNNIEVASQIFHSNIAMVPLIIEMALLREMEPGVWNHSKYVQLPSPPQACHHDWTCSRGMKSGIYKV
jgi:hypothetical protein